MPPTADDRIILVRVKIERAKQNFRDLQKMLEAARDDGVYLEFVDVDPQTGMQQIKRERLPLFNFSVLALAGDVIHNLRSALDHLAYALAIAGTDDVPKPGVGFPIAKDEATYESIKERKVEGIRPEAVELIDSLKPYNSGNDCLWRIHELDIVDKHRSVLTIGENAIYFAEWLVDRRFFLRPRGLKAKSPSFARIENLQADEDVDFAFSKAFFDKEGIKGQAIIETLFQFIGYVESLIPRFKPFLG